jgi:hypothetical protein
MVSRDPAVPAGSPAAGAGPAAAGSPVFRTDLDLPGAPRAARVARRVPDGSPATRVEVAAAIRSPAIEEGSDGGARAEGGSTGELGGAAAGRRVTRTRAGLPM